MNGLAGFCGKDWSAAASVHAHSAGMERKRKHGKPDFCEAVRNKKPPEKRRKTMTKVKCGHACTIGESQSRKPGLSSFCRCT
ncbi:hypothetical protein [uncultured Fibrobacter sp.]|uniref:hypothetical protein n=1 Tax=uncultured Fibrobacter sp. TaxID=261512 RepID=UPI002803BF95|nr:hypothetical protein [uncultured Fibrobacter sp.]